MARIWIKLIFICLMLLISGGSVSAATNEKDWQVPVLGVFRVPQEFMAAEFPDLKKMIDSQKGKLDAQAALPIPNAKDKLNPDRLDFAAYQLTMNDGQAYHLAWLVVLRDRVELDKETAVFFDKPLDIEQRVSAILAQDKLSQNLDKMQYNDPSGFGIKVLGFDEFDFGKIAGKQAYAGGVRFLFNYQDFLFPFYARGWIFNSSGHGAAVLLVCTDSERLFWTPVLNNALTTIRPLPTKKK